MISAISIDDLERLRAGTHSDGFSRARPRVHEQLGQVVHKAGAFFGNQDLNGYDGFYLLAHPSGAKLS